MVASRAILASIVVALAWLGAPAAVAAPPLKVVATTGMIADTARAIGGPAVEVTALMGEGVDPHLYKASPGDVRLMTGAGLLLWNGLHLEGRLGEAITKLGSRVPVVCVTDPIPADRLLRGATAGSVPDPHVWFDPGLWRYACERIRDAIIERTPDAADAVRARCVAHLAILDEAARHAQAAIASVPAERRILVTAHDAFGYFGRAFGVEVHGIQGLSTDSEASLRELNALIDLIVSRKVPAVFIESSVPRKAVEALVEGCSARGHRVVIGGELLSDALGPTGTMQGTHVGMIVHDAELIARALGGSVPPRPAALAAWLDAAGAAAP